MVSRSRTGSIGCEWEKRYSSTEGSQTTWESGNRAMLRAYRRDDPGIPVYPACDAAHAPAAEAPGAPGNIRAL
ncbi:hypothetical protein GCM10009551_089940 [Nocardiopsis tropica]